MAKKWKGFSGIIFLLVFILAFLPGRQALAEVKRIPSYDSLWEVQPNGDVKVTETIEFDIGGSLNGLYRDVDISPERNMPTGSKYAVDIDKVSVAVVENGQERPVYMVDQGTGKPGQFEFFLQRTNLYRFKVYEPSRDEVKLLRFRYTLKNVIVKYKDVAVLNWKMIDSAWDVTLNNVRMTIKIPAGAQKEDLRIFSHGDLTGFNEIIDAQTFNVQIAEVEPGQGVENRVVFPLKLVPDSKKTIDRTELPTILAEEGAAAEAANQRREEARRLVEEARLKREAELARQAAGRRLNPLVFGAGGLGLAIMAFILAKFGRERKANFDGEYYRELPGDYTPAVMSEMLYNSIETKDLMATLLDLARKKIIHIEPYTTQTRSLFGSKEETDYRLVSTVTGEGQMNKLEAHERFLYEWFIQDLGNGQELTLDDLERTLKKESNARAFTRDYTAFKGMVSDKAVSLNFREPNDTQGSGMFYLIALALAGFGAFMIAWYGNFLGILPIVSGVLIIVANITMAVRKRLTQYGADQTAMWKAFRKFLLDFSSMDRAEIPSLTIWNHYLVYATSLGVAKEVIEQLPKVFTAEELRSPTVAGTFYPDFYYGPGFNRMDRTLNSAVSQASATIRKAEAVAASRNSSSSGHGGGFSGGSSGGGGGGGGGGGF